MECFITAMRSVPQQDNVGNPRMSRKMKPTTMAKSKACEAVQIIRWSQQISHTMRIGSS